MTDIMTDFVVSVPLANIYHDPAPTSEVVTQALLNTAASAGEYTGDWTHVTLSDYAGWIRTDELETPIVKGFCEGEEGTCGVPLPYSAVVTATHATLYQEREGDKTQGELYLATVLPFIGAEDQQRLRVALPGERIGWLSHTDIEIRANNALFPTQALSTVTNYAKTFLGVPYLWGGTSWQGIDCSGFVQLCYRMAGYVLPRDADQQHDALHVSIPREQMQEGDLIFFGKERITHVALALNKHEYIHAEGQNYNQVTINSFDQHNPIYNPSLAERVWALKRVRETID